MRFGEIATAVATLTVVELLLDSVLLAVLIPMNPMWGPDVAGIIAILVASLIVGYMFAAGIQEGSRVGAIGRIVVMFTLVMTLANVAFFTNPYMDASIKEGVESMFSTSGWTTTEWFAYSHLVMIMVVALNAVLALVFSFIGLYAGSKLRKPKQGQQ